MRKVGSLADAERALRGEFEHIGSGVTRRVYVDDNQLYVYKIQHIENDDTNQREWRAIQRARQERATRRYLPPAYLYDVNGTNVMCMRYYPVLASRAPHLPYERVARLVSLFNSIGVRDVATFNCAVAGNGQLRIIDLGAS